MAIQTEAQAIGPEMSLLVSVCVPAYRQPEVLLRTVRSVLMQEGCDFELVITDDTDDDSVEMALAPFRADSRLRYLRNSTRLGAVGNWNASLAEAKGDIVKILHHDDWLATPTALLRNVEPIMSGAASVVLSACRDISLAGQEMSIHCATQAQVESLRANPSCIAFANIVGAPSVVTCDRTALVEFDLRFTWLADVEFYIRLLERAKGRMHYIEEPLINVNAGSAAQLSRECEAQKLRSAKEYIRLFAEHSIREPQPGKTAAHFVELAQSLGVGEILLAMLFATKLGCGGILLSLFKGLAVKVLKRR